MRSGGCPSHPARAQKVTVRTPDDPVGTPLDTKPFFIQAVLARAERGIYATLGYAAGQKFTATRSILLLQSTRTLH